jgi:chitinase
MQMLSLIVLLATVALSQAATSQHVVVYWGQNSYGVEKSLGDICADDTYDIIIVGFITQFYDDNNEPVLNLASHCCSTFKGKKLLHCPKVADDIKKCQNKYGKKVMLSLGGAIGPYGFRDETQAIDFARIIWQMFLSDPNAPNTNRSISRPFDDTMLDGIDLDIETGGSTGYQEFVHHLRKMMDSCNKKRYYLSGAPQCPFPDENFNWMISNTSIAQSFDFLNIQYYDNPCNYVPGNPTNFKTSWGSWTSFAKENKIKLNLGLLAEKDTHHGYVQRSNLCDMLKIVTSCPSFGGVMIWDSSWDYNNVKDGMTYSQFIRSKLTPEC